MSKEKNINKQQHKEQRKPSYLDFDESKYHWKPNIDYRKHPDEYRVGKGEQGVLICEPYKTEIGPLWRFKDGDIALKSATAIYQLFLDYLAADDFVGADMARKYLQMGFTRARRYANYKGGKKYDHSNDYKPFDKGTGAAEKVKSADVFYGYWQKAESNEEYSQQKIEWKNKIG